MPAAAFIELSLRAIACQNLTWSSRHATPGRPGEDLPAIPPHRPLPNPHTHRKPPPHRGVATTN